MTQAEYEEIQKTFPWTEQVIATGAGGLVRVLDRNGHEVPLFVMTKFLMTITRKLEKREAQKEAA